MITKHDHQTIVFLLQKSPAVPGREGKNNHFYHCQKTSNPLKLAEYFSLVVDQMFAPSARDVVEVAIKKTDLERCIFPGVWTDTHQLF